MSQIAFAVLAIFAAAEQGFDQTTASLAPVADAPQASNNMAGLTMDAAARHARTCKHYGNRARYRTRIGDVSFVAVLADACNAARDTLHSGTPSQRVAARRFLDRLAAFCETINDMNLAQYRLHRAGADAGYYGTGSWSVTEAGEVLIARSLGVTEAFETWLQTMPGFVLAQR